MPKTLEKLFSHFLEKCKIHLFSIIKFVEFTLNTNLSVGTERYGINTSNLGTGFYYLTIRMQEGVATQKMIVK